MTLNLSLLIEIIITILSVFILLNIGVFIGREFGTLEKFIIWYLNHLQGKDNILPPYDDGE